MNNEDKKGLNKFQFSTEIDRVSLENAKEEKKTTVKKKTQGQSVRKNAHSNTRKTSNRKYIDRKTNARRTTYKKKNTTKEVKAKIEKDLEETIRINPTFLEDGSVEEFVVVDYKKEEFESPVEEAATPNLVTPSTEPEEIPLLEDEEELLAARNRKISIVNEVEIESDTNDFDEIPTAFNTTVTISEEDITPVNEEDILEEIVEEEEEIPTEVPAAIEIPSITEEEVGEPVSVSIFSESGDVALEDETFEEGNVVEKEEVSEVVESPIDEVVALNEAEVEVNPVEVTEEAEIPVEENHEPIEEGTPIEGEIGVEDTVEDVPTEEEREETLNTDDDVMGALESRNLEQPIPVANVSEKRSISKFYLDFRARIILLVLGILVLFGTACFIIISALKNNEVRTTMYNENIDIDYEVCSEKIDNSTKCLGEDKTYKAEETSKINLDYDYTLEFDDKDVKYNMSYYVLVRHEVYDAKNNSKVLYEKEEYAVNKKKIDGDSTAEAKGKIVLDYDNYNQFVEDYKTKYASNVNSSLEAFFYVNDGQESRVVSKITIPLGTKEFKVVEESVSNEVGEFQFEVKEWTNTNTLYIVIGSCFILLSLFLLFHLTKLALAVTGKKSKYQDELMAILNEYDRLIVIARDGYESNVEKKTVKVSTFEELLEARGVLNKPIIYSRVNNIKSEFIVEDDVVIYKFVLKEADLEK